MTLKEQINFCEKRELLALENYAIETGKNEEIANVFKQEAMIFAAIADSLKTACNEGSLHYKKCQVCSTTYEPKNQMQEFCSTRCRVRYFRKKNQLNDFTVKVQAILETKNINAKFGVQLLFTPDNCPFAVTYKGIEYKANTIRELLNQLKKI